MTNEILIVNGCMAELTQRWQRKAAFLRRNMHPRASAAMSKHTRQQVRTAKLRDAFLAYDLCILSYVLNFHC